MSLFRIVFENDDFLVTDKDAGIPVIPERWEREGGSLFDLLSQSFPGIATAHRIDKDTSGLVVWVKHKDAARHMTEVLERGAMTKEYLALVEGRVRSDRFSCDLPLLVDGDRQHRTVVDQRHGKESRTDFVRDEVFGRYSVLIATLGTGRTHQIRAHLASMGTPLCGDALYGGKSLRLSAFKRDWSGDEGEERPFLGRPGLHARRVVFPLMGNLAEQECMAPLPKDLATSIKQLRKYAR